MSRRSLLAALFTPRTLPTDIGRLNSFAAQYNVYIEGIKGGIVDARQWERVLRAWERLNG